MVFTWVLGVDLNSGPHDCSTCTLLTEPRPSLSLLPWQSASLPLPPLFPRPICAISPTVLWVSQSFQNFKKKSTQEVRLLLRVNPRIDHQESKAKRRAPFQSVLVAGVLARFRRMDRTKVMLPETWGRKHSSRLWE